MNIERVAGSGLFRLLLIMTVLASFSGITNAMTQYVNVTILSSNDAYTRNLGIAINSQLPNGWWNNASLATCNPTVSAGNVGTTYSCAFISSFNNAFASVSSFVGYVWGLRVLYPNGQEFDCYNIDNTARCPASGQFPTFSVISSSGTTYVDMGQQVTINAQVTGGTPPYYYQWYTNTTTSLTPVSGAGISGQTGSTLVINTGFGPGPGITYYKIQATDSAGHKVLSLPIQVAVNPGFSLAAQPTPVSQSVTQGQTAIVTDSGASGGAQPYHYQWLEEAPGASMFTNSTHCASPTSNICSFTTGSSTPTGTYYFELQARDSAQSPITLVTGYSAGVTVNPASVSTTTTTTIPPGATCNVYSQINVGGSISCGSFTVVLQALGYANAQGVSPAAVSVYQNGVLRNQTSIYPKGFAIFGGLNGQTLTVNINQTFPALYTSQQWAQVSIIVLGGTSTTSTSTTTTYYTTTVAQTINITQNNMKLINTTSGTTRVITTSSVRIPIGSPYSWSLTIPGNYVFTGALITTPGFTLTNWTSRAPSNGQSGITWYFNTPNYAYVGPLNETFYLYGPVTPTTTTTISTTTSVPQSSCNTLTIVYVSYNLYCNQWSVKLTALGQPTANGVSPASVTVYYNGVATNASSIYPQNTVVYTVSGQSLYLFVNQTFAGLYPYQQWAKMSLVPAVGPTTTVPPPTTVKLLIYSYDNIDPLYRYFRVFLNRFPGSYLGNGQYSNNSDYSQYAISNGRVVNSSATLIGYYTNVYFTVSQDSGSSYGNYSGVVGPQIGSSAATQAFSGLDAYHALRVVLNGNTMVSYTVIPLPSSSPTTTTSTTTTTTIPPGSICNVYSQVNVGGSISCGSWQVVLQNLGSANSQGVSPASVAVYQNGVLLGQYSTYPKSYQNVAGGSGQSAVVNVNQTFPALYTSQRWAQIQLLVTVCATCTTTTSTTTTITTTVPVSGPAVNVTLLTTNDIYLRYLAIAINKPLGNNWWLNSQYTCQYFVSSGNLGTTYQCAVPGGTFINASASVSSFVGYVWGIRITYPNGASFTCYNINNTMRCPTIYTPPPPPYATMAVQYTTQYGSNFTTTMNVFNGDGKYPYYYNIIFQDASGNILKNFTEYTYSNYTWYGWNWGSTGLQLQGGNTYTVKAVITDANGRYLATTNAAQFYVPVSVPTSGPLLNVTVLSTNDTYSRYLGIAIDRPLSNNWWLNGNFSCDFVIGPGSVGSTYSCAIPRSVPFTSASASVSSYYNYKWTVRVSYPIFYANGTQATVTCIVNNTLRCPSTTVGSQPQYVNVTLLSTNDTYARFLGIAINKQLANNWWLNNSRYTCDFVVGPGNIGSTFNCAVPGGMAFNNASASLSSFYGYRWIVRVTYPNGASFICPNINNTLRCPSTGVTPPTPTSINTTFTEFGVHSGLTWVASFAGKSLTAIAPHNITFTTPPGTYNFSVPSVYIGTTQYVSQQPSGRIAAGTQNFQTTFIRWQPGANTIFHEVGLPIGIGWGLNYNGTQQTVLTPNNIVFSTAPGVYRFNASWVYDLNSILHIPSPATGNLTAGSNQTISYSTALPTTSVTTTIPTTTLTTTIGQTTLPTTLPTTLTTTVFPNACIAAPGYLCQNPVLDQNGDLAFILGQAGGTIDYNIALACTANSTGTGPIPSTAFMYANLNGVMLPTYNKNRALYLVSGQAQAISELTCYSSAQPLGPVAARNGFTGTLWLNYTLYPGAPNATNPWYTARVGVLSIRGTGIGGGGGGIVAPPANQSTIVVTIYNATPGGNAPVNQGALNSFINFLKSLFGLH